MGLRALEAKYLLDRGVEEVFWYVHKLLTSLFPQGEGPSISVQTAKPFTYTNGKFVNKREKIERDFEFFFETKNSKTEMIFRWFYASDWASMEDFDSKFFQDIKLFNAIQRLMKLIAQGTIRIEKIEQSSKLRCSYCNRLFDETLAVCPHCGAPR